VPPAERGMLRSRQRRSLRGSTGGNSSTALPTAWHSQRPMCLPLCLLLLACDSSGDLVSTPPEGGRLIEAARIGPDDRVLDRSAVVSGPHGYFYVAPVVEIGTVAVYDSLGVYSHSFGRRGAGPGELEEITYHFAWSGDTIAVVSAARVSLFASDGSFVRSFVPNGYISMAAVHPNGPILTHQTPIFHRHVGPVVLMDDSGGTMADMDDPGPLRAGDRIRRVAWLGDNIVSIPRNELNVRVFNSRGRLLRRVPVEVSWLEPVRLSSGVRRHQGAILDVKMHDTLLWILVVRYRHDRYSIPAGEDTRGHAGPRPLSMQDRVVRNEPHIIGLNMSTGVVEFAHTMDGQWIGGLVDGGRYFTREEADDGAVTIRVWRIASSFQP
jgi:hypothetical protein